MPINGPGWQVPLCMGWHSSVYLAVLLPPSPPPSAHLWYSSLSAARTHQVASAQAKLHRQNPLPLLFFITALRQDLAGDIVAVKPLIYLQNQQACRHTCHDGRSDNKKRSV